MRNYNRFHLWIPNLFEFKGGIQTYSAFFLQALQNIDPDATYDIFVKHDTKSLPDFPHTINFHCSGTVPLSLRTPAFAAQILTQALFHRPDLIISTHLNFTPVAYLLKRLLGIPYWTVAHGIEAWNIQDAKIKKALHHCDRILAVSQYTGDRLTKEQGLNPEKISILYNTFDSNRFQPAEKPAHLLARHDLTPEQPIILTVGRLSASERYKGYDQMIQSMVKIRSVITNVHYIIVGKGDDQLRYESAT